VGFFERQRISWGLSLDALNRLVKIIGQRVGIPFPVHFHMLRHSCG
jgi:integrase